MNFEKKAISKSDKFFIAGAYEMAGRAIQKNLLKKGYGNKQYGGNILNPSRK